MLLGQQWTTKEIFMNFHGKSLHSHVQTRLNAHKHVKTCACVFTPACVYTDTYDFFDSSL